MNEVTIICCYNNSNQYDQLISSLKKQSIGFELMGIDNTEAKYKSCAKAFNDHIKKVVTPYVVFCHQDIEFTDGNTLSSFVECIKSTRFGDIIGVAGRISKGGTVVSNILQGDSKENPGKQTLVERTECEVVDECFFGGYTDNFVKYPFDESLCNNWHLYAVDRCLNARVMGYSVYICPITLIHKSKGKMNSIYNRQFYLLSKKYSRDIDYLNTTCAYASTRFPFREIAFLKRAISMCLGRY